MLIIKVFFGAHILFVSITAHIVATVKKLYEILHISVRSELFLIPKFRLTFKLILKINVYQYKIQQFSTHKNQWNLRSCNEKKLKLIPGLMCFKNVQPISHY